MRIHHDDKAAGFEAELDSIADGKEKAVEKLEDKDQTMKHTSNAVDSGKLSGYSNGKNVEKMYDDYTGADNDDFIHQMIEDYGTKATSTDGNPDGIVLTRFNGERATRTFIETALKLDGPKAEAWMEKNFRASWEKYDVNKQGSIDEKMVPTYFRSLLGDFTAQFNLREEDRFKASLRNHL